MPVPSSAAKSDTPTPAIQRKGHKAALSQERILAAAIEILSTQGEAALTFRALSSKLNTGAGALYWHIAGKSELLQLAASSVVQQTLAGVQPSGSQQPSAQPYSPQQQLRRLALATFDTLQAHPWLGQQLSRQPWQPAVIELFEHLGQQVGRCGVPLSEQFNVTAALVYYLLGLAAQQAAAAYLPADHTRVAFLAGAAQSWSQLDEARYPFTRQLARELPQHDDRQQFLAGIDLILRGLNR